MPSISGDAEGSEAAPDTEGREADSAATPEKDSDTVKESEEEDVADADTEGTDKVVAEKESVSTYINVYMIYV